MFNYIFNNNNNNTNDNNLKNITIIISSSIVVIHKVRNISVVNSFTVCIIVTNTVQYYCHNYT